jgi:hypothetical protein
MFSGDQPCHCRFPRSTWRGQCWQRLRRFAKRCFLIERWHNWSLEEILTHLFAVKSFLKCYKMKVITLHIIFCSPGFIPGSVNNKNPMRFHFHLLQFHPRTHWFTEQCSCLCGCMHRLCIWLGDSPIYLAVFLTFFWDITPSSVDRVGKFVFLVLVPGISLLSSDDFYRDNSLVQGLMRVEF